MLGIIGALEKEVNLLRESMTNAEHKTVCSVDLYIGELAGQRVVLARSGMGKVCASVCAAIMINLFGVNRIINTGIAGGMLPDMRQGDFAVASGFVQHDVDSTAIGDELGYIFDLKKIVMEADGDLSAALAEYAGKEGRVFRGIIATGDQFIADSAVSERIKKSFDAIACDMEGGAIAQVCDMAGIPFSAVRCISDNANGDAGMDYPEFAVQTARKCAGMIIKLVESGKLQ